MLHELKRRFTPYSLDYCARSAAEAVFYKELSADPYSEHVHFHFDGGNIGKGLQVREALSTYVAGEHVYCCGPTGLMEAVRQATMHWPRECVHFEAFKTSASALPTDQSGKSFDVILARTGRRVTVDEGQSILAALRESGVSVDSMCEEGYCGTCIVGVVGGEIDHRDTALTDAEHAAGKLITVCCSRSKSKELVLDL